MATAVSWNDSRVPIAGIEVSLRRGGSGPPMLMLHHDFGPVEGAAFYDALAAHYDVLVPEHPGFGDSERPEWMRSVRDLAVVYRCLLDALGIERSALVGLGFGGWVAAEMATMAPHDVDPLVLVGAMGIRPEQGHILDQALLGYMDYVRSAFSSDAAFDAVFGAEPTTEQLVRWDICREMCFRIAWKPYMYSLTLPHLLQSMRARTLVVWGGEDRVVPREVCERYASVLPNAESEIYEGCGHAVALEQPERLAQRINEFARAG